MIELHRLNPDKYKKPYICKEVSCIVYEDLPAEKITAVVEKHEHQISRKKDQTLVDLVSLYSNTIVTF